MFGGPILSIASEPALWTAGTFVAWFMASYVYHCLGITLGYHRLLTHKAVKVPRWLMYLIVSGGYLSLMGSPIVWVGVHRLHHQKSDLPGDPHSPNDGFAHALYGWMYKMRDVQTDEELQRAAGELMQDPIFKHLGVEHKPFQAQLCLGINIALRVIGLFVFGWVPMLANSLAVFILFFSTQAVNAVCHLKTAGYRLFDTKDGSRNVWWVAILTMGEGWHNNHHALPRSARHGMAWWEIDGTWCAIWILEKLGLGTNVVRPPKERMPWANRHKRPVPVAMEANAARMTMDVSDFVAPPAVTSSSIK